jgi:hypothetical protein
MHISYFPTCQSHDYTLQNVSTFCRKHFVENVVTFFREELYQHFSGENVRLNIFLKRFINIFHENVEQHFLKMFQHFQKKSKFFPSFTLGPPVGSRAVRG